MSPKKPKPPDLTQLLRMPAEQALEFWRSRVTLTPEQFAQLDEQLKGRAFTVAGVSCAKALNDVFGLIDQALQTGMTARQFITESQTIMERRGVTGVEPFQLKTTFQTNMQTAYQAGRYRQMKDPAVVDDRPFWKYSTMHDNRTRPSHRALDATVRRHDDPWWNTHYPPNGYNCRCGVQNLTADEVEADKLTVGHGPVTSPDTGHPIEPDEGFRHNPASMDWQPDLSTLHPAVRAAFESKFGAHA